MAKANGLFPPTITVFQANGTYDEQRTRAHIDFLIDGGVHGICPMGSTGEFIGLSEQERKGISESVIEHIDGRVQVYPGVGHYSTHKVIGLAKHAQAAGADGVMIVNPYYLQPPKARVLNHFREIRCHIDIPIMLYNNPYFSGYELSIWEVAELSREGVIQSIKLAHGAASQVHDLKLLAPDLTLFYGHDVEAPQGLLAGADGWVTSLINVVPDICAKLFDLAKQGRVEKTMQLWQSILPLVHFLIYNPSGEQKHWLEVVKTALNLRGRDVGAPLPPLRLLDQGQSEKLRNVMEDCDLL